MPAGFDLEHLFQGYPDQPLPSIAAFDRLYEDGDKERLRRMNLWIDRQMVCSTILKHHGTEGLQKVTAGIAKASSMHKVPMSGRVKSAAGFHEWDLY
tara:strand:+ start:80 stop:370 length:291 start_codon:yes stop_codon:yes gene_type:complete